MPLVSLRDDKDHSKDTHTVMKSDASGRGRCFHGEVVRLEVRDYLRTKIRRVCGTNSTASG